MSNKSLRIIVPVSQYPAYVFNKLALTGRYGRTREEVFGRIFDGWFYNLGNFRTLQTAKISQEAAKRLGYIPIEEPSNAWTEEERKKRLLTQNLFSKEYNLNLEFMGMQAYLMEKVPESFVFPEVSSQEGLVRKIHFDWVSKEQDILRKKFGISRPGALKEKYLVG